VENVQDYLSKSNVIVVPIMTGAGMRIKILEAFAMGKAVVSSSLGAEGIAYSDGENIMIADNPVEFAEKICYLLKNKEKAETLGSNARQLVEREYDADVVWKKWRRIYDRLLSEGA
jgi:glycosyltransferase involved in cell wall biosynthesis